VELCERFNFVCKLEAMQPQAGLTTNRCLKRAAARLNRDCAGSQVAESNPCRFVDRAGAA